MSRMLRSRAPNLLGVVVACALFGSTVHVEQTGQTGQTTADMMRQMMDARPDRGQNVAPVFEGWEPNDDGTFDLYFGYMNRNWSESVDIPVSPGNSFEPGSADRGQPTHFLPRRHKQIFTVNVPKDFGRQALVWTISIRGKTEKVRGSLRPEQQIDVSRHTESGNTPPAIQVTASTNAVVGQPHKFSATVTDDGLPKARSAKDGDPRSGLNVRWAKYRGPGAVAFESPITVVQGGKSTITAVFSEPGEYVVQALADDGSMVATSQGQNVPGYACCWTIARVHVTVSGTQIQQR